MSTDAQRLHPSPLPLQLLTLYKPPALSNTLCCIPHSSTSAADASSSVAAQLAPTVSCTIGPPVGCNAAEPCAAELQSGAAPQRVGGGYALVPRTMRYRPPNLNLMYVACFPPPRTLCPSPAARYMISSAHCCVINLLAQKKRDAQSPEHAAHCLWW